MKIFKKIIKESFSELEDYRRAEGKRHLLINLIMIAVCAVIGNAECEKDICEYGKAKKKWI